MNANELKRNIFEKRNLMEKVYLMQMWVFWASSEDKKQKKRQRKM